MMIEDEEPNIEIVQQPSKGNKKTLFMGIAVLVVTAAIFMGIIFADMTT
jgi:hypothetical protein